MALDFTGRWALWQSQASVCTGKEISCTAESTPTDVNSRYNDACHISKTQRLPCYDDSWGDRLNVAFVCKCCKYNAPDITRFFFATL